MRGLCAWFLRVLQGPFTTKGRQHSANPRSFDSDAATRRPNPGRLVVCRVLAQDDTRWILRLSPDGSALGRFPAAEVGADRFQAEASLTEDEGGDGIGMQQAQQQVLGVDVGRGESAGLAG